MKDYNAGDSSKKRIELPGLSHKPLTKRMLLEMPNLFHLRSVVIFFSTTNGNKFNKELVKCLITAIWIILSRVIALQLASPIAAANFLDEVGKMLQLFEKQSAYV